MDHQSREPGRLAHPMRRVPAWVLPVGAVVLGVAPFLGRLADGVATAHEYWYDAVGHLYLSWERFQSLTLRQGFFDFRWFAPYADTGTYNEPAVTHGLLFGLFDLAGAAWPLAFNLAMIAILALNALCLYALLRDAVRHRWLAAIFAVAGALGPFAWTRYAHPPNTVIFWGLLGLLFLRRAARRPTWLRCAAAPALFTAQLYSSFYTGMFFLVPLVVFLPAAVARARASGHGTRFLVRSGIGAAACLPLLAALQLSYADTREQLGTVNTHEYVSEYMKRDLSDFADASSPACRLGFLGVHRAAEDCRAELFPGWPALAGIGLALAAAGLALAARRRRRTIGPGGARGWLRLGLPAAGAAGAILAGSTWPFHLGLWAALALPGRRPGGALALGSPFAVPAAAALLVCDVALNPVVGIGDAGLASIHRLFFEVVPGFDGLRSEYRIVVLLSPLLAWIGALAARRLLLLPALRRRPGVARAALAMAAALVVFESLPAWQGFAPLPRSDRIPPALAAARDLPAGAVLAVVKGRGLGLTGRRHWDANYFLGHIPLHRHRQVTGYSTYNAPGSEAVEQAARVPAPGERLPWAARAASLLGATHLLVDWREAIAPEPNAVERWFEGAGLRLAARDAHMALGEILEREDTARGPVPSPPASGKASVPDIRVRAGGGFIAKAADGDPRTAWGSRGPQRPGDEVRIELPGKTCVTGLAFTPGLQATGLPTAWSILVSDDGEPRPIFEKRRWEIPSDLIAHPLDGRIRAAFDPIETDALILRVDAPSPFPWILAEVEAVGCPRGAIAD
jgi:hypothetical protein